MKDDFFACLTREIKDEVMERYVTERRIMEIQIDNLHEMAKGVRATAEETAKRLTRLAYWMLTPQVRGQLIGTLCIPRSSPWRQYLERDFPYEVHSLVVSAFRDRTKLRKIIIKSYDRVYQWMDRYGKAREDLGIECEAVRANVRDFQNNAELQTVLGFLKALDTCGVEKSHFLGGNFTAEELASVEQKLSFKAPAIETLGAPPPLSLPEPHLLEPALARLADTVFDQYRGDARRLMELWGKKGY